MHNDRQLWQTVAPASLYLSPCWYLIVLTLYHHEIGCLSNQTFLGNNVNFNYATFKRSIPLPQMKDWIVIILYVVIQISLTMEFNQNVKVKENIVSTWLTNQVHVVIQRYSHLLRVRANSDYLSHSRQSQWHSPSMLPAMRMSNRVSA